MNQTISSDTPYILEKHFNLIRFVGKKTGNYFLLSLVNFHKTLASGQVAIKVSLATPPAGANHSI